MIDNCISLILEKKEKTLRNELFRKYIADSFKIFIESYYSAHEGHIDLPSYKDWDSIIKEYKKGLEKDSAESIKSKIIKKLKKAERKR